MKAREIVEQFFNLICKTDVEVTEFEELVQSSYREQQERITGRIDKSAVWDNKKKQFVSSKDRSKVIKLEGWQNAIQTLLNKKPKAYRVIGEKKFGLNMINFSIEIPTRFMKLVYSYPNAIRENGVWQINPISIFPKTKQRKK